MPSVDHPIVAGLMLALSLAHLARMVIRQFKARARIARRLTWEG